MQTIASVQRLMEQVPANPAPSALVEGGEYRQWLENYRESRGLTDAAALVDKVGSACSIVVMLCLWA